MFGQERAYNFIGQISKVSGNVDCHLARCGVAPSCSRPTDRGLKHDAGFINANERGSLTLVFCIWATALGTRGRLRGTPAEVP
jgi:hypothetical protein